ncbi:DUF397 domain-containing protein [Streptomyces acidiscabies]|uniref:DUF397 domain-containing protein n=1 Tax=Streptomyces acidiscabies TaxID=42234 RepID=UPI0030D0EA2E
MSRDRLSPSAVAGAIWRASSYSGGQGECVEVATNLPTLTPVRDSKHSSGPVVVFAPHTWRSFIAHLS